MLNLLSTRGQGFGRLIAPSVSLMRRFWLRVRMWASVATWRQSSTTSTDASHLWWVLPLLYLAALWFRLSVLRNVGRTPLEWDEVFYWQAATGNTLRGFSWLQHPPLWPFALKIPALFSQDPHYAFMFCSILGATTPVITYLIGYSLFGRRVALVAGLLVAFAPQYAYFSNRLFKENLSNIMVGLSAWMYLSSVGAGRPVKWREYAAFLLGVALLADEKAVVYFFALAVAAVWHERKFNLRSFARESIAFILPFIIATGVMSAIWRKPVFLLTSVGLHIHYTDEERKVSRQAYRGNIKRTGIVPVHLAENAIERGWTKRVQRGMKAFPKIASRVLTPRGPTETRVVRPIVSKGLSPGRRLKIAKMMAGGFSALIFLTGIVALVLDKSSPFRTFTVVIMAVFLLSCLVMQFRLRYQSGYLFILALNGARLLAAPRELLGKSGIVRLAAAAAVAAAYLVVFVF